MQVLVHDFKSNLQSTLTWAYAAGKGKPNYEVTRGLIKILWAKFLQETGLLHEIRGHVRQEDLTLPQPIDSRQLMWSTDCGRMQYSNCRVIMETCRQARTALRCGSCKGCCNWFCSWACSTWICASSSASRPLLPEVLAASPRLLSSTPLSPSWAAD